MSDSLGESMDRGAPPSRLRRGLLAADGWLVRRSRPGVLTTALLMVGVLGAVDHFTGYEISFSVFYLAPVALAAWYLGRRSGLAVSFVAALVWFSVDKTSGHVYDRVWIAYWNSGVRLTFFLVTAGLLGELRRHLGREQALARIDPLTGLKNSRAFHEEAGMLFRLAARHGHPITLAYMDVDDFKRVNDERGHEEGDRTLQAMGALLAAAVRSTDVVARLGGDEFAVLLPFVEVDDARRFFAELHSQLLALAADRQWPIGFSFGVAVFRKEPPLAAEALRIADALMYRVKRGGKNKVVCEIVAGRGTVRGED